MCDTCGCGMKAETMSSAPITENADMLGTSQTLDLTSAPQIDFN